MESPVPTRKGFNAFLFHFLRNVKQWLLFMFYLSAFRLLFLYLFRSGMDRSSTAADMALAAWNGMRFDSIIATYVLVIPFLLAVAPRRLNLDRAAERADTIFARLFIGLTTFLWTCTAVYFREYNQQFDHFIFNLYYDDTRAILLTIWSGYHPLAALAAVSLISWALTALRAKFLACGSDALQRLAGRKLSLLPKIAAVIAALPLIFFASRGTFDARPIQPQDIGIVADAYLNKTVLNPYFALIYAVQDHMVQNGSTGLSIYLPDGDIRRAAADMFHTAKDPDNLDSYLEKHAKGPKGTTPRHIFLILMESYDAWPLLPRYASLGLTPQLTALGREGISFDRFLPSSMATSEAFCVLVTSLPYPDLKVNYQYSTRKPYPSSIFSAFKRLGYRTRLFYGGYLTWQRFGDFARDQGVEEIYGAPNMNNGLVTHEWGIDDEYLFDFVRKKVDDDRPSFNLILTTSYHAPFDVDVYGAGFPLHKIPEDLASSFDGSMSLKTLGHIWYGDKCLGSFTRTMEKKLPQALFAFTGDHFSRRFINANPDYFERSAVPFILYGKDVLKNIRPPRDNVGSQLDIGATLIELAAPKGFTYYAAGQDLLAPKKENVGFGWWRMIGKDFLFDIKSGTFHRLPGSELPKALPDANHLRSIFYDMHGIGWWRVKVGPALPPLPAPEQKVRTAPYSSSSRHA